MGLSSLSPGLPLCLSPPPSHCLPLAPALRLMPCLPIEVVISPCLLVPSQWRGGMLAWDSFLQRLPLPSLPCGLPTLTCPGLHSNCTLPCAFDFPSPTILLCMCPLLCFLCILLPSETALWTFCVLFWVLLFDLLNIHAFLHFWVAVLYGLPGLDRHGRLEHSLAPSCPLVYYLYFKNVCFSLPFYFSPSPALPYSHVYASSAFSCPFLLPCELYPHC